MRLAPPPSCLPSHHAGLTLIELLVAVAVLSIIATIGIPNYQRLSARNEVAMEVMRIQRALALTRNTAITRRSTVAVCASQGPSYSSCNFEDWSGDWVIVDGYIEGGSLAGEIILKVLEGSPKVSIGFSRRDRPVRYKALGRAGGHNGTFRLCGRGEAGATVIVNNAGRVRIESDALSC
ncbi:GspH/FimT family pseudopilin [Halomonas sp. H10-9-1]|uniref:GspH/FimT family pseudopilin n=1 Tax=Halomonas sp. H10-9-1 TaxID=2950871 RepID=UPI0032DF64B8